MKGIIPLIQILVLACCLLFPASNSQAQEPPPALMHAIARQESGLNPLAVNVAGKSYSPATREEAERIIRQAITEGKSFDVGKMQINNWWMKRFSIEPFSLLDPEVTETWAKWILEQEIARHGLNWQAVGKYHSPDPERGRQYAWLVYKHYAGQGASKQSSEPPHAQQKDNSQNVSDPRGIRANQSFSQQVGAIPFHLQQKSVPWVFRPKSGASGRAN